MGTKIYGQGFTFDDTDRSDSTGTIAEMDQLVAGHPANKEVISPYIGWKEIANDPTQSHHRFVINFGERPLEECRSRWPELVAIVENRVRPERMNNKRKARRENWWRFGETTPGLFSALSKRNRVLVTSCAGTPHLAFAFQQANKVFAQTLAVIIADTNAAFCALQARPHEIWARFFSSSMKDDLRYTPSDCLENFPFMGDWQTAQALETAGHDYYQHRADLMVDRGHGLTETYNRFHDPDEDDLDIMKLRDLHAAMDKAVLDAYGWTDLRTRCDFFLDYDGDDEGGPTHRKKPWRYRWPDEVQDQVLARLIKLNTERAADKKRAETVADAADKASSSRATAAALANEELF